MINEIYEDDNEQKIESDNKESDYESKEKDLLPVSDGEWEDEVGDSYWYPDDEKVPRKMNPDEKTWEEIKEEYDIDGIEFVDGEPDFTPLSRGEAHIEDFSDNRDKNFTQADEYEAQKRGCTPQEVADWRHENKYTWHERKDCETMDKVPSIVHNNIVHSGGISEKKKEINLEGVL